jgi:hypothetical protein
LKKWNFSSNNLITCASIAYFRFPQNASTLEGKDKIQTERVTTTEKAAIKGYESMNNTSNATVPAVIGLLRLAILLN